MVLFLVIIAVAAVVAFLVVKSKKVESPIAHVQKVEEKPAEEAKPKAVKKVAVKKSVKKEK